MSTDGLIMLLKCPESGQKQGALMCLLHWPRSDVNSNGIFMTLSLPKWHLSLVLNWIHVPNACCFCVKNKIKWHFLLFSDKACARSWNYCQNWGPKMFYVLWKTAVYFLKCVNKHFKPNLCLKKCFTNCADGLWFIINTSNVWAFYFMTSRWRRVRDNVFVSRLFATWRS